MAIYGYTKNYKLIKPQFNTDTWHDYIYDNLDTIDAVMSAIYASGNWKGFWAKNMTYVAGDVIIDQDTDTMYKVMIDHVTSANTFAAEQTAHPDYYELWSPNNLAESWATKADGKVSNTDYSAKAYAISSGLISEGSAKEWAIGSGTIGNTGKYSAEKYATDAHNDYISMTTNVNVVAVGSNIANVNAVGQSISNVNTVASDISSVNVAATNIEFIKSAENNANDAKNSKIEAQNSAVTAQLMAAQAQEWATKTDGKVDGTEYSSKYYAGQASDSASNSHIWAEGTDAQVQALGGVHSSKGWAEQSTNANIALTNSPYTTNRILEIPQDIKLELNNGTLTLKAGSKVHVPNGFEADGTTPKFDVVTIANDTVYNTVTTDTGRSLFFLYSDLTTIGAFSAPDDAKVSFYFSGPTAPTVTLTYALWYDTTNNIIKNTFNNGETWQSGCTLPFSICSYTKEVGVTSIDQVFNGFGYIGSTIFALPGVKYEYANGLNSDGAYVNGFGETTSVITTTYTYITATDQSLFIVNNNDLWRCGLFSVVENPPTSGSPDCFWYVQSLNCFYSTADGTTVPKSHKGMPFIQIASNIKTDASFKVTNIDFETVDGLLTSNANNLSPIGRSYLSGLGMPSNRYIDLTLGASGSTYTAPANGTFYFRKRSTAAGQYISLANLSNETFEEYYSSSIDQDFGISMNVLKGVAISANYTFGGTTYEFKFVYAEGEN